MKTKNEFKNQSWLQSGKGQVVILSAFLLCIASAQTHAAPGDLDLSFDPGSSVNASVQTMVVMENDKVMIGGLFSAVHGVMCNGLARLNADGSVDSSFPTELLGGSAPGVRSLALQSDGRILVAGTFTSVNGVARTNLARLNADGTLDDSFLNGLEGPNGWIASILQLDTGKILIGGGFTSVNGIARTNLARLNPDGSLDDSFEADSGESGGYINCIVVQTNGQILVGGLFHSINNTARTNLARLNPDGSLDDSFNPGLTKPSEYIKSMVIQTNGQILVGGYFYTDDGIKPAVVRLNADGTSDASFVADMEPVFYPPEPLLALQPDNKILIGGGFTSFNNVARTNLVRLNADGTLDVSFSADLYDPRGYDWSVRCLVFQSDGRMLVSSGPSYYGYPGQRLTRLNTDGSTDYSFKFGPTGPDGQVRLVKQQPDGRMLIGGEFISVNGVPRGHLARLMPDGSLDDTFLDNLSGADGSVRTLVLQTDGKILVGGEFSNFNGKSHPGVVRLNTDGSLDTSFLNGLEGPRSGNYPGYVYGLAVQNDGKIVIGGSFWSVNGVVRNNIARLNADGSLDSSVTSSGGDQIGVLVLQTDGKILFGTSFPAARIRRLDTDGITDHSFHAYVADRSIYSIAVQDDGKILIGGWFTTVNGVAAKGIARLNTDGTLDQGLMQGLPGPVASVYSIILPGDGTILVGGSLSTNGPLAQLARLNKDGSLDSSFSGALLDRYSEVDCVTLENDGKILVAGNFTSVNGTPRSYIARLLSDYLPPVIQTPPQSQTVGAGSLATFHVEATSAVRPAYQWFFNATNVITGVTTNPDLVLTNVQRAQSGDYAVVVTSAFGAVTSSPAMLMVTDTAPTILEGPLSQTTWIDSTAHLSVSAIGSEPLVFQWLFNETNAITSATANAELLLTNVQFSQAGNYSVIVTNAFGAVTSAPAKLDVLEATVVKNPTESDLRAAMAGGGRIIFACDGTITLGSTITIDTDTTLDGSGHEITFSGGNVVRAFQVADNVNFTLINLTIANGLSTDGYGGGIYNAGILSATKCRFVANLAQGVSGANSSPGQNGCGGAVYNAGALNITACSFTLNSVRGGEGGSSRGGSFYDEGVGGAGNGGAICNFGVLTINSSTFSSNSVFGGIGGSGVDSLTGELCGYGRVGGGGNGGAVCNLGVLAVTNSTFSGNSAFGGTGGDGGSANFGSNIPISGGSGGPGGNGNGSALFNGGSASLINTTIALNSVGGGTGGEGGTDSWPTTDEYFSGRGPDGNGGSGFGAICDTNGQIYLTNCTLASNFGTGEYGGTGGYSYSGTAFCGLKTDGGLLINTILAGNSPSNCSGTITDAGHNLSSDNSCAFTSAGSLNNVDPMLGPFADYGGPTLTMTLLPGSPAIDAGDDAAAPPSDQRGFPRPVGAASDIGACEGNPANIVWLSPTQTAEQESSIDFAVGTIGDPAMAYLWFFNETNLVASGTNADLVLTNLQLSESGVYTVIVSNVFGAVTSAPITLNVVPRVERTPVPGINMVGDVGSLLNVDCATSLKPPIDWLTLDTVSLTSTPQFYFDLTPPLPPQRYYRVWQTGTPSVIPSMELHFVPAIALTGSIGDKLRLDYINAIGPTDAWVTLDTVTLTNTSQLYFDTSSISQPRRLYRIVPVP